MSATDLPPGDVDLPPLTARSIVLSVLLGSHPAELTSRELVRVGSLFGVAETTLRAALSRMVGAGELVNEQATYRLTDRLLARQARQDAGLRPALRAWRGGWEFAVVTAVGRTAAERASLRDELARLRLAELREGVWTRPANLRRPWPGSLAPLVRRFRATPADPPDELVGALWDLPAWADRGQGLLERNRSAREPADRFTVAATVVRHLLTDPVLPEPLQPPGWPAAALRAAYADYQEELAEVAGLALDGRVPGSAP